MNIQIQIRKLFLRHDVAEKKPECILIYEWVKFDKTYVLIIRRAWKLTKQPLLLETLIFTEK